MIISPQTAHLTPAVLPGALHVASTAGISSSVCSFLSVVAVSVYPQTVHDLVFEPSAVQLASDIMKEIFPYLGIAKVASE